MALNGEVLEFNGELPALNGTLIDEDTITVEALSYGFIVFESTTISVCG